MVEDDDGNCQGIQCIGMGDNGEPVTEIVQARWPGSLLIAVVRALVAGKWEMYKEKLPKRKKPDAPPNEITILLRKKISQWHGHVTLWVLVGTLMNVLGKVYMNLRYEDIARLHFEKFQSKESSEHWQNLILVAENEHKFWEKFLQYVKIYQEARLRQSQKFSKAAQERAKLDCDVVAHSKTINQQWRFLDPLRALLSYYQKLQQRQHQIQATKLQELCQRYDESFKMWKQLEEEAEVQLLRCKAVQRKSIPSSVSHAADALFWKNLCSRELVLDLQIPWTGIVIRFWRPAWTGQDLS